MKIRSYGIVLGLVLGTSAFALDPREAEQVMQNLDHVNNQVLSCDLSAPTLGCSSMVESFCSTLFDNKNKGNLDLPSGDETFQLRFGKMQNGLDYPLVAYNQAKLDAKDRLPASFREKLDKVGYFQKVQAFLNNKGKSNLTQTEKVALNAQSSELSQIWNDACREVAIERTEKLHPGYDKADPTPPAWEMDYNRIQAQFGAEIYADIWQENPLWKKTSKKFDDLKSEYVRMLEDMTKTSSIPAKTLDEWIARIKTVELESPGTNIDDPDQDKCGTTEVNAYYTPTRNKLTVCAGDFTAEQEGSTLGHELTHALDIGSQILRFESESELGKTLIRLRKNVCGNAPIQSCPKEWLDLRSTFDTKLAVFDHFTPQAPQIWSCLQYRPHNKVPTAEVIDSEAESDANNSVGILADRGDLLNLTKPTQLQSNGVESANPLYLNPCGKKKVLDELADPEEALSLIYTLQYVCASETLSPDKRMTAAANSAVALQKKIFRKLDPLGGKLSPDAGMISGGYSENSAERFADDFGQRAFARTLVKDYPDAQKRREVYLANMGWACDKPSNEMKYPKEAQVQKTYSQEPHSTNRQRRNELLIPEIREALQCKNDTDTKECRP